MFILFLLFFTLDKILVFVFINKHFLDLVFKLTFNHFIILHHTYNLKVLIPPLQPDSFSIGFAKSDINLIKYQAKIDSYDCHDDVDIYPSDLVSQHGIAYPLGEQRNEVSTNKYQQLVHVFLEV